MSTQGYIMLSYQWDKQEVVKKIRDRLRVEGYNVWIDIEQMQGSLDAAMAGAVKDAGLVLACLSKKYEESDNCHSEASCIKQFKRPFIPLMMEKYELNGWVAGIFSRCLYVNFSNEATFDNSFQELLRLLQNYPSLKPQVGLPNPNPQMRQTGATPSTANSDIPHMTTNSDTLDTPNTEPYKIPALSKANFLQLLVDVSKWWKQYGKVRRLKVLLYEFKEIPLIKIEESNEPSDLFKLLRASGHVSRSNIDVLLEAAVLGGLQDEDLEEVIRKTVPTFQGFSKVVIRRFSKHRRNLMEFGQVISSENMETIGDLYDLPDYQRTDQWVLIFELEKKDILTEQGKESFIKTIENNEMIGEIKALTKF